MVNKRRRLAGARSENQLAAAVRKSAHRIWMAGLGAFSSAREEGNKGFQALVKEGKAIQPLMRKAAEANLREAAAKAAGTRRMLEQVLQHSIARSLKRFGVPTRKDIDTLAKRIVALTALIDKLPAETSRNRG